MSFKAVQCAIRTHCTSPAAHLVLIGLADHYNHRTGWCFPSQERLAAMLGLTKRTVQRAVVELEAAKLITRRKGRRVGSYNASTHYRLDFYLQARLAERKARLNGYANDGVTMSPKQGTSPSSVRTSDGESSAAKPPKRRSQARAIKRRLPRDWKPSEKVLAYAVTKGLTEAEALFTAEDFRDYYIGKGDTNADWNAVWYRWARRQVAFKESGNAKSGTNAWHTKPTDYENLRRFHEAAMGYSPGGREREGGGDERD